MQVAGPLTISPSLNDIRLGLIEKLPRARALEATRGGWPVRTGRDEFGRPIVRDHPHCRSMQL